MNYRIGWALAVVAATILIEPAGAGPLKQIGAIAVPGRPLKNVPINFIDHASVLYYLGSQSIKAVGMVVRTTPITGRAPKSVASSEATGHVFVPVNAVGGGDGTTHVFAPAP